MIRKGILLAGGSGTRLHPMTRVMCKQLLPIYDKPMIYYPLSTLMLAGIREILIITTPKDEPAIRHLLGDGRHLGLQLSYAVQAHPNGIAEALLIGERFLDGEGCALILGDNIFYAGGLVRTLQAACEETTGALIFAYWVKDPERYGVVEFDADGRPIRLIEKPQAPSSNYAVTGLYFYDAQVCALAKTLTPSARGELEITDLNRRYLERGALNVQVFGRGVAWLDTGTPESLLRAANFIETLELRQGLKIGCPEEIAYRQGFITQLQLAHLSRVGSSGPYREYLEAIVQEENSRNKPLKSS